ncbi:MAG: restriction endonuclease subunit S [Campylobacterota bacterium]|nr:restriction endonuclease subunit S [Campylobacterota bacterium]
MLTNSYQNDLITQLQFTPKENSKNTYEKKYSNYIIEIDLDKNSIDYGNSIFFNDSNNSIQKITKPEDLVVLECVDRLLTQGYAPKNIILEKVYPSGHGTSGRLDVLVVKDDNSAYMMIECKTWGKEFDTAFKKLHKDGGQLFTYFQQDKDAEVLVLYASQFINNEIQYINQIVKIEKEYKATSNVKDFYDRWNKIPKNNGVFDSWTTPYNYKSKALTPKELIEITSEDSSKIFNRFMEILRHNVVSDKPNAFSKIFTLFLCKIMDEKDTKPNSELGFQWIDGVDTDISFQKRLTDLYQKGMKEFLDKEVSDLSDAKFEEKFGTLDNSLKEELLEEFTKIRLQKNNEFAIKDVFDQDTFEENAIVVKEVVELLQNYQIRYTKKQQFLSDFFELLLTTGLKQEVGQFFTPVPIAKFIIRSIPFDKIINKKLSQGVKGELLPNVIDYAVGSGHFITEAMDEIQKYINLAHKNDYISDTSRKLSSWKVDHFDWAYDYVYGIEKDYRLVKTAKVGCYLHGDGLAKVIHGDGLANFTETKEYKGKLTKRDADYPQDNKQFDMVISNPPYSVSAFKNISKKFNKDDFELYEKLTDQSSEIEALFIERTKQLLKDGGIAGIILPSSILSNGGIYTKTREIIFKYFDIISITELGSNTFMATGTNTVVLFLRRKNNMLHVNIKTSINKLFDTKKDITINGIEKPLSKYVNHTWEEISIEDYFSLLNGTPSDKLKSHEIYQEYDKKIGNLEKIVELEKEKLFYFVMAYSQKVTLIKTGEKKEEKRFLGYEFSNRRGSEGIHAIQRGKTIDECTTLYDEFSYENSLKANSYIYSAFNGKLQDIDDTLKDNISYVDLVDMMTFDRVDFEKSISLIVKKKVEIESKWDLVKIKTIAEKILAGGDKPTNILEAKTEKYNVPIFANAVKEKGLYGFTDEAKVKEKCVTISARGTIGYCVIRTEPFYPIVRLLVVIPKNDKINLEYMEIIFNKLNLNGNGAGVPQLTVPQLSDYRIPLPPKEIQEKIVKEIESLKKIEENSLIKINELKKDIANITSNISDKQTKLQDITTKIGSGATPKGGESAYQKSGISLIRSQNVYDNSFIKKGLAFIDEEQAVKLKNVTVEKNDILFNITGASIARCCIVDEKYLPARVNQHVSIIRTNKKALSKYIQMILINSQYKSKLLEIGDGGTSREAITKSQLEEFKIPLPPIEEQKKIVSQIEAIEKEIKIKEQEIANIPKEKENILEKYLK